MKKITLTLVSLGVTLAAPASAQIDPGYRAWIPAAGLAETADGDLAPYSAYRVNTDGSITYRLVDGREITIDSAKEQAGIVNTNLTDSDIVD